MSNTGKLGLVLSGGGGRGYFHLGVAKALSKHQITPDIICGTSAGSIAGALMAAELDVDTMEEKFPSKPLYNFRNISWGLKGLAELNTLRKFLTDVLPYDRIEDLPIPFIPVSSNLNTGTLATPKKGKLLDWVLASCAIPILVEPVKIDGHFYVDGGLLSNMPAEVIQDECDYLIGVNLFPKVDWTKRKKMNIRDVGHRSMELFLHQHAQRDEALCDLVITDTSLGDYNPQDYGKMKELLDLGFAAAEEALKSADTLLQKFSKKST